MSLLVLSAGDVRKVASSFSTTFLQELMGRVFTAFSRRDNSEDATPSIQAPHRTAIETKSHTTLFMPVRVTSPQDALEGTTVKVVSVPRSEGDLQGLPATTLMLNEETGAVEAVINARELTALRNAGGSLLSATLVGIRQPQNIVFFGSGKQIGAHLDVFLRHYPSISSCTIVNRNLNERALNLYTSAITDFPRVTCHLIPHKEEQTVKKAVEAANIIVCATSSTVPLFPSSWVSTGTHIILVGSYRPNMQEVEEALVHRAESSSIPNVGHRIRHAIIVDSRDACAKEAGDLIKAEVDAGSCVEIGELLLQGGNRLDNENSQLPEESSVAMDETGAFDPVTIYKSVGIGLQDAAMAKEVVAYAKNAHLGTYIKNYDTAI
ncbi:hypothetical protein AGABI1DRAFT_78815 [Agaricus bisporus var. burnettii JB137-S8]|uniref:Ornithine cyclodeaminase n=1 Tax=Agaricus bisporus var. burnettii (strain JB137-S8 / ATCC MYA-4627 / FGSC 10392) TaxID=597362 RepID=K5X0F2_AGABU|nr:uncharacterized protein AGABI1DRAFT_78815 [Agaricus bisporus var. burnettii JB137-S8]EKM76362.1 hypothetical protein AGABI1DRAFT_78815 [Agaricus bisporus var. burnettii JB137-S8]